ncbi:hypothetical protein CXK93_10280 [Stutzerimonas decontaminans]|uniref:Uncharacterized protein n=1 Tax=Stutzerimonas decontaminans TaxID=3022791 RepID=A0ABX4VZI9_9GAMM|nr:hypothetical protein CXK93_10280 [Stutzerimonas decontaminans]
MTSDTKTADGTIVSLLLNLTHRKEYQLRTTPNAGTTQLNVVSMTVLMSKKGDRFICYKPSRPNEDVLLRSSK